MAIRLEATNLIVPRTTIESRFPGGWDAWLVEHRDQIGVRCWHDDHLFRDGNGPDASIGDLIWQWSEDYGFSLRRNNSDRSPAWDEFCVIEAKFPSAGPSCDWLTVSDLGTAHLAGTNPGAVVDRFNVIPNNRPAKVTYLNSFAGRPSNATEIAVGRNEIYTFPDGTSRPPRWDDDRDGLLRPMKEKEAARKCTMLFNHVQFRKDEELVLQEEAAYYEGASAEDYLRRARFSLKSFGIGVVSLHRRMHPQKPGKIVGCDDAGWGMFSANGRLYNVYRIARMGVEFTYPGGYLAYRNPMFLDPDLDMISQHHPAICSGIPVITGILHDVCQFYSAFPEKEPPIPENYLDGLEFCL